MTDGHNPLSDFLNYPLMQAIFGRRSRRFGLGMEIPSGPLAHKSRHAAVPLTELEQAALVAAGTGVSGFNFGVPFGPAQPDEHGSFTERFTGRTAPTPAGLGTPVLFHTDDEGTYLTNTRDVQPSRIAEYQGDENDAERILAVCREHTVKLSSTRLDLPRQPPHVLGPNMWMANAPGSTLFLPMADTTEEFLGLTALALSHGAMVVDTQKGRAAGNLQPFLRSGLIQEEKVVPLAALQRFTYEGAITELAFIAHNIVLAMQAMGLGGLYWGGLEPLSAMGAFASDGIKGLGFRFVEDERWDTPNPVGLDEHYQALCPPYFPTMREAVEVFVERKFGPGGAYDPKRPGPWKDSEKIRRSVRPYSDEYVDCLAEIAQYTWDIYGKIPGNCNSIVLSGVVQAQHIDLEFYDRFYEPGAYLPTHAQHMKLWHGKKV